MTKEEKIFIKLGWEILEHKFRYYYPELADKKPISDAKYDKLEDNYKKLANKLGKEPTATNHVGFPLDSPSGRLISQHLGKKRLKKK